MSEGLFSVSYWFGYWIKKGLTWLRDAFVVWWTAFCFWWKVLARFMASFWRHAWAVVTVACATVLAFLKMITEGARELWNTLYALSTGSEHDLSPAMSSVIHAVGFVNHIFPLEELAGAAQVLLAFMFTAWLYRALKSYLVGMS